MKVALSACSNGIGKEVAGRIDELVRILSGMGIEAACAPHLYAKDNIYSGTDMERAQDLMDFYNDDSIDAIYDVTGGDLANGVIRYLDWDIIRSSNKVFWGYSDLTTVINAIYTKTGRSSVLYQVRNLTGAESDLQIARFRSSINGEDDGLFGIEYDFLQGDAMEGVVLGGNIRCLLKLAGCEYWPDLEDKILLLESYGGDIGAISTALSQLDMMGAFDKVSGILLGTFTKYESTNPGRSVFDLLREHIPRDLPVARTAEIGHGPDSKAIVIGEYLKMGGEYGY